MEKTRDAGYVGSLVSLSGAASMLGYGSEVTNTNYSFTGAVLALTVNSRRRWALIISNMTTGFMTFAFDDDLTTNPNPKLLPNGVIQIDQNLPWTGPVKLVWDGTNTGTITVIECNIAGV